MFQRKLKRPETTYAGQGRKIPRDLMHRLWKCDEHEDCFSPAHLNLLQVQMSADTCEDECNCWRHAVIAEELNIMFKQPSAARG